MTEPDPTEAFAAFDEPFAPLARWWDEAWASEPDVPDAMQVATVDAAGRPTIRTVLLKALGHDGLVFYTNTRSRKGRALADDPRVAALLHWKSRERQVNVEGVVGPVTEAEADAYWASRPRGSQIGGWASLQSEPLPDRATLVERVAAEELRFHDAPVPRPPHWSGYRIVPDRIELWQGRRDRLHVRWVWTRTAAGWTRGLLYP
jgi:pyridoxamine 5'-phosphate oxidase